MNFLSRYPEATNIATLKNINKIKKGRILQEIRLWNFINICQASQFFSLPRQIKPEEEFSLTKIWGQEHQAIHKCKETSFINWLMTKRLLQKL